MEIDAIAFEMLYAKIIMGIDIDVKSSDKISEEVRNRMSEIEDIFN